MSTGDPMWECPFCKRINYFFASCTCGAWSKATARYFDDTLFMPSKKVAEKCTRYTDTKIIHHDNNDLFTTQDHHETLVVNLFAGPGAGKSTMAAGIYFDLKSLGITSELASEYAKDLVWEERNQTFDDQIYIFGKQFHRIFRLMGKVKVIITDSPLLLTPVYDKQKRQTLENLAVEESGKMWHYNIFIKRKKKFNPDGRISNEKESVELDVAIINMLDKHEERYEVFEGTPEGKNNAVRKILKLLDYEQNKE